MTQQANIMREDGSSGSCLWSPSTSSGFRRRSPYSAISISQSSTNTYDSETDDEKESDQSTINCGHDIGSNVDATNDSSTLFGSRIDPSPPLEGSGTSSVKFSTAMFVSPPRPGNDAASCLATPHASSATATASDTEGSEHVLRGVIDASTELHEICQTTTTVDALEKIWSVRYLQENRNELSSYASKVDVRGRTPLHLFAANKFLSTDIGLRGPFSGSVQDGFSILTTTVDKRAGRFLVRFLLPACPAALLTRDDSGFIPFERGILDWISICYSRSSMPGSYHRSARFASFPQAADKLSKVWETASTSVLTAVRLAGRSVHKTPSGKSRQLSDLLDIEQSASTDSESHLKDHFAGSGESSDGRAESNRQLYCAPDVHLDSHMYFTLAMMSLIVDRLDRWETRDVVHNGSSKWNRENFSGDIVDVTPGDDVYLNPSDLVATLVEIVASIPDLMKTILLICDDDERQFALSTSIIRRVMFSGQSMGCWITAMLQNKNPKIAERPVHYLKLLSNLSCSNEGVQRKRSHKVFAKCDDLVVKISRLEDFIPSLLALGDRGVEEASTTLIVSRVLDLMISRPFAVTVVLCDIIFLSVVILGFRAAVNQLLLSGSLNVVLRWIYVANTGIFYFIIREIGKTVSLFLIAKQSRRYFLSFWNLIDMLATVLPLLGTVLIRCHFTFLERGLVDDGLLRAFLAVTTGFLWLRVLSVLKAINQQLATFVLAIIHITREIFWFCIILLVLVVSFSQIFYTLLAPQACTSENMQQDCLQGEWLLRVYTILLGELDREHFKSGLSVLLVVFYSFMVTVVLLNVLIAVASDIYERCLMRSRNLFGRARVMLIAELVSFEYLLQKSEHIQEGPQSSSTHLYSIWRLSLPWTRGWSQGSMLFLGSSLTVVATWTVGEITGYSLGERNGNILFSLASIVVNACLFVGIMAFLSSGAGSASSRSKRRCCTSSWYNGWPQRAMTHLLGSSKATESAACLFRSAKNEEWSGRMNHLQEEMTRIADDAASESRKQCKAIESFVSASESRVRSELIVIEDCFEALKKNVSEEMKSMREENIKIHNAIANLHRLLTSQMTREHS